MLMTQQKQKNRFTLPNELYLLKLSPGAIAVYSYLLCIEDRETYQCYPSYKTIGERIGCRSVNTVKKYVTELEDKGLITTEHRTRTTPDGQIQNSTLLYNIRPIQEAVDLYNDQQMAQLELDASKANAAKKLGATV